MPFNIGPGELIVILIIALIVVGPGKLPDVGSALGKSIREFRKAATDVKESVAVDTTPAPAAPVASALAAPVLPAAAVSAPPVPSVAPASPVAVAAEPAAAPVAPDVAAITGSWPAEVTPVDEQQPTASA